MLGKVFRNYTKTIEMYVMKALLKTLKTIFVFFLVCDENI